MTLYKIVLKSTRSRSPSHVWETLMMANSQARTKDAARAHASGILSMYSIGPTPHVRGTLLDDAAEVCDFRSIPVCVGNTNAVSFVLFHCLGSSPRVRGTRRQSMGPHRLARIIPACAGNTGRTTVPCLVASNHPRVCGEHNLRKVEFRRKMGSSPRVRGTLVHKSGRCACAGIIPACAGNTEVTQRLAQVGRDHPRVCGEHTS